MPLGTVLLGVGFLGFATDVTIPELTRDTADVAGVPFYTGAISNLGIVFWIITASVCLLTAEVLPKGATPKGEVSFVRASGYMTAVLGADDLFMVHDAVGPRYLGISSEWIYGVYVVVICLILVRYRAVIMRNDYVLLVASLAFLAASLGVDVIHDLKLFEGGLASIGLRFLLEDGLKLLGIGGWLAYFVSLCHALLTTSYAGS